MHALPIQTRTHLLRMAKRYPFANAYMSYMYLDLLACSATRDDVLTPRNVTVYLQARILLPSASPTLRAQPKKKRCVALP